jgi:hypothetical protein
MIGPYTVGDAAVARPHPIASGRADPLRSADAIRGMTDEQPLRGLSDGIGRLERDLERLDRKVDAFLTQHQAKHDMEQQALQSHLLNSAKATEQAQGLNDRVRAQDGSMLAIGKRLETLELERAQVIGAWRLMKFVLGASLLSLLVNIVALAGIVSGAIP